MLHIDGIGDIEIRESGRVKHLKLAVSARKGIHVVKPRRLSDAAVKRFVVAHKQWLKKQIDKMPEKLILRDGDKFSRTKTLALSINANDTELDIIESDTLLEIKLPAGSQFESNEVQEVVMKRVVKIWRREAKIYLPKRIEILGVLHDLQFNDVRVKYMHTRWGSCSSLNNINLNIQLMRLEPELIDHVLIHELCHTREHNHSKNFWKLFESCEPGARVTSKSLKSVDLF